MEIFNEDLAKAGTLSLPVTLVILLIAFGTLVAAGIPLLLAITAVLGTMGLVGPLSQLSPVEETINHVILLIGLAVGVDYALFYLRRAREERAAGRSAEAALEAAAATSGRAVLVSGITVMIVDGRHVPRRHADVHVVRDGHDRRRRRGDARLADRAARADVQARRPHREGPRPRPRPAQGPDGEHRHLVAHRRPGAQAPGAVGRPVGRAAGRHGGPGASAGHRQPAARRLAAAGQAGRPDVQPRPGRTSPRSRRASASSSRATTSRRRPCRTPSRSSSRPPRENKDLFPGNGVDIEISPDKTVATLEMEIAGDGANALSNEALDVTRDELVPETLGQVDGAKTYVDGDDRPGRGLQRHDEGATCRSSSGS